MRDPRAVEQLARDLEAQLVTRIVALAPQEEDGDRLFGDRRMGEADHGVVVELAHHVERRPVLGVLVPLTLDAPGHHPHHAGTIRERNAPEELDRELLRFIRLRPFVHALVEPHEIAECGLDVIPEITHEAQSRQRAKHEAEGISERGARPRLVAEGDHRVVGGARQLRELSAGRERQDLRAALAGFLEARERLLGVPGVARRDHERVAADVRRKPVVAVDAHGHLELVGEERCGEVATDRRAAHPGDGDRAHVAIRRRQRRPARDAPGIAGLLAELFDAAEHVFGVAGADPLHRFDRRRVHRLCYRHLYAPLTIASPASTSGLSSRSSFVSAYTRTSGSVPDNRTSSQEPSSRKNFAPSFVSSCTILTTG